MQYERGSKKMYHGVDRHTRAFLFIYIFDVFLLEMMCAFKTGLSPAATMSIVSMRSTFNVSLTSIISLERCTVVTSGPCHRVHHTVPNLQINGSFFYISEFKILIKTCHRSIFLSPFFF